MIIKPLKAFWFELNGVAYAFKQNCFYKVDDSTGNEAIKKGFAERRYISEDSAIDRTLEALNRHYVSGAA